MKDQEGKIEMKDQNQELDVVQLCETQKIKECHAMVSLVGLCG